MRPSLLLAAALSLAPSLAADLPRAVSGDLWVSDFNNDRVVVYRPDGTFSHAFTAPGLDGPRGVVFAPNGRVYVASQNTDEVFVFDHAGNFHSIVTDPGLSGPTGCAISPAGELHVASFNIGFVCVFDLDGNYQRAYTAPGFTTPNCVTFDSAGNVYASSAATGRVYKWDANELFVTWFTHPTPGGLASPMGIARDTSDVLYVAGGSSSNVVKFTTDGTYLGELSHPDLTGPQGVAFDDRGHLFSASFFQNKLVEFDADDAWVQTVTTGGLSIPRTIAFQPAVASFRNDAGGTNAPAFSSTSLPTIGSTWTSEVDTSGVPGAALTVVLGYDGALEVPTAFGVVLADVTAPQLLYLVAAPLGDVAQHAAVVPADPGLVGRTLSTQAAVVGGGITLTNALDLELGAY